MKNVITLIVAMLLSFTVQAGTIGLKKCRQKPTLKPEGCIKTKVDYSLSIAGMTNYYDINFFYSLKNSFRLNPRSKGKINKEICWFKFKENLTQKAIRKKIEFCNTFLVADVWELHAFAMAKPNFQRKYDVIGLGTIQKMYIKESKETTYYYPMLTGATYDRHLNFTFVSQAGVTKARHWDPSYHDKRFLAIRK